jgi:hypothetical protein
LAQNMPRHFCGNIAVNSCSWPNFWAAYFSLWGGGGAPPVGGWSQNVKSLRFV